MKYVSWIFLSILILAGLIVSIYMGIQPKPVPLIKLSQFHNPEQLGKSIYERLRLETQSAQIVFLGVEPEKKDHIFIWNGFLGAAQAEGVGYSRIFVEPKLTYRNFLVGSFEDLDMKNNFENFVSGVDRILSSKERVAIVGPSIYISYLIQESPLSRLFKMNNKKFTSFPILSLSASHDDEKNMDIPCVKEEEDRSGTRGLACMALNEARQTYRKQIKAQGQEHFGIMSRVGETEALVLYR